MEERSKYDWVPKQEKVVLCSVDTRNAGYGPQGYKEKNKKRTLDMLREQEEAPQSMEEDEPRPTAPDVSHKRQKVEEGHPYRTVSGKIWKEGRPRMSALKKSGAGATITWEKKQAARTSRQQLTEIKQAAAAAHKAKLKAKSDEKRAAKERKKINQAKSAIVQQITNPATLKKMMKSKKQRKLLTTMEGK